jgi:hypothetical protein
MRMDDESRINDEGSGSAPCEVLGSLFLVHGMIAQKLREIHSQVAAGGEVR